MQTGTHEIADRICRLSTCVSDAAPGGFAFNQFLVHAYDLLARNGGGDRATDMGQG